MPPRSQRPSTFQTAAKAVTWRVVPFESYPLADLDYINSDQAWPGEGILTDARERFQAQARKKNKVPRKDRSIGDLRFNAHHLLYKGWMKERPLNRALLNYNKLFMARQSQRNGVSRSPYNPHNPVWRATLPMHAGLSFALGVALHRGPHPQTGRYFENLERLVRDLEQDARFRDFVEFYARPEALKSETPSDTTTDVVFFELLATKAQHVHQELRRLLVVNPADGGGILHENDRRRGTSGRHSYDLGRHRQRQNVLLPAVTDINGTPLPPNETQVRVNVLNGIYDTPDHLRPGFERFALGFAKLWWDAADSSVGYYVNTMKKFKYSALARLQMSAEYFWTLQQCPPARRDADPAERTLMQQLRLMLAS